MRIIQNNIGFGTLVAYHKVPEGMNRFQDQGGSKAINDLSEIYAINGDIYKNEYYTESLDQPNEHILFITDEGTLKEQQATAARLRQAGVTEVVVGNGKNKRCLAEFRRIIKRYYENHWKAVIKPYLSTRK